MLSIKFLKMTKLEISYSMNKSLVFDLQIAIKVKSLERVQSILKSECELNLNDIKFIDKSTPLSYAIYIGFEACIQLLLENGSDPNRNSTDHIGRIEPPLCTAIRLGDSKTVKLLLNHKDIDVNRPDFFIQMPAYLCVRYRQPEYLQLIIKHKDFNLKTSINPSVNMNPLYLSAKYLNMGRLECFQILINCGFKVNQRIVDYVIRSENKTALRMIEMCMGKVLSSETQSVPTLKQLTRIVIRNIYAENSGHPFIIHNIEKSFSELPKNIKYFLADLRQES